MDALSSHIAILDEHGAIIKVNAAWTRFARENDLKRDGVGENYLCLCDTATGGSSDGAAAAAAGIREVIVGQNAAFELEYPCHSPREHRWFLLRVSRFAGEGPVRVVVAHENITVRKQAEKALQESERLLRTVIDLVPHFIFVKDSQSRHLLVNQACAAANGLTPEEMKGKSDLDFVTDRSQAEFFMKNDREVIADGQPKLLAEESFTNAAGQTRILQTTKIPFNFPDGGGSALVGVAIDITERKQAEEVLHDREQRLRLMLEQLPVIAWATDTALMLTSVSGSGLVPLGIRGEDLVGQNYSDLYGQDSVRTKAHREALRGIACKYDVQVGGRHFDTCVTPLRDAGQKIIGCVGVAVDITERKNAEERIKLQLSALTATANAIVITDVGGKIEWVNPAFTQLTGYAAAESIGNFLSMLKSGQHSPGFYANLWATIATGNVWRGEVVNKRKDGTLYTEEMTITPVRGADGEVAHFVAIKQDVTERRLLENQLRQAQKMEAIGVLAGGIAHDFNNILGAIICFTEVAKMDHRGDAELQENLNEVLRASERAASLVRQILSFSRQQQLERTSLQISLVVKEALKLLRATLPSTITIDQTIAADLPEVLADPTQIHQVIMNLCTNAAHAMRGTQGQLRVQMDVLHVPLGGSLPNPALVAGDFVRLIVSDTGCGMEAAVRERIFEPFFTTKHPGEGTGLGLSVVHGIVKEHEGVIAVESEPGRGTIFTIYFPAQAVIKGKDAASAAEIPQGAGERVLFVDDEEVLGHVAHKLLDQLGYQPFVFSSAEAAWSAIQENPEGYDVLISDLTMPVMTGLELASRVFQLRPDLPIILSSGNIAMMTRTELQAPGIRDLLAKPLNSQSLALTLDKVLHEPARLK